MQRCTGAQIVGVPVEQMSNKSKVSTVERVISQE